MSGADTGFALGTQGIGSAVVLNGLFWLALVAFLLVNGFHAPTSHHGGSTASTSVLVYVAAAIGVVLMAAFGALFYLLTRGQKRAEVLAHRVAVRLRLPNPDRQVALVRRMAERFAVLLDDRPLLYRAIGWATANWVLDAASLWVFVAAFSHFISPVDLLVAYGLANILAAIPITPGGLGVVEFVLVSMITGFGPTAPQALSAVLAYRAVNFWLPIPFGGLAYASLEFERGTLYRRLSLFFLHRYQRRREAAEDRLRGADPTAPTAGTGAVAGEVADGEVAGGEMGTRGVPTGEGADSAADVPEPVSRADGTAGATSDPAREPPGPSPRPPRRSRLWARASPSA